MNVKRPKVPAKLFLLLDANVFEVLIAENDDASLGDEESQLVLLDVVELTQLKTPDFGSNTRRQIDHFESGDILFGQEIGLFLVGDETSVVELEGFERGKSGLGVIDREVCRVFVLGKAVSFMDAMEVGHDSKYLLMNLLLVGQGQLERGTLGGGGGLSLRDGRHVVNVELAESECLRSWFINTLFISPRLLLA